MVNIKSVKTTAEETQDIIGAMLTGNTETLISVEYQDGDGTIDFAVEDNLSLYDNTTSGFISGIRVSADDTTDKYLEDAITVSEGTNSTSILELSTLNDGADEDLNIQIDESKIDHGSIGGLSDDDHTQYSLVNGTRPFSATVGGVTPTLGSHLATKDYVDSLVQGLDWQDSTIDKDLTAPPVTPLTGDRYIVGTGATGAWSGQDGNIAEYNGVSWDFEVTNEGFATWVEDENILYVYNGTAWVKFGSTVDHGNLSGLGDDDHTLYLLASDATDRTTFATNWLDLTDGGDTILHTHSQYLTAETDPIFSASDSFGIDSTDIGNWDDAYSWGDHALVGYLTVESDPVFSASDVFGVTTTDIGNWDDAYSWGDHALVGYLTAESDPLSVHLDQTTPQTFTAGTVTGTGLLSVTAGTIGLDTATYLTTETDPVFSASDAFGIDSTDITNWDTAYGWGDHSGAGYLTAETDPLSLHLVNETNDVTGGTFDLTTTGTITTSQILLSDNQNITWGTDEHITFNGTDLVLISALNLNGTLNSVEFGITSGTPAGLLTASGNGSLAFGDIEQSGEIRASGKGSMAHGNGISSASASTIFASGAGATSQGYVASGGDIVASGNGAMASGATGSFGLTASGIASHAFGYADTGAITASADNSFQFGVGTNARVNTAAFGTALRLRFDAVTTTLRNGDIWSDTTDVFVQSGGVSRNLSNFLTAIPDNYILNTGDVGTGVYDFGGATSFEIPNSATPTVDANGEIAIDTTVTNWSHGIMKYYGGEEMGVLAMPIAQFTTPSNGYLVAYNATNDEFELVAPAGGSGDITSVGDVTSGAAFDGTQGTTLTFYNAGGNKTLAYDGVDFDFNTGLTVTAANLYGQSVGTFQRTSGEYVLLGDSTHAVYAVAPTGSNYAQLASDTFSGYFSNSSDSVTTTDGSYGININTATSGNTAVNIATGLYNIQIGSDSSVNGMNIYDGTKNIVLGSSSDVANFSDGTDSLYILDGTYGLNVNTSASGDISGYFNSGETTTTIGDTGTAINATNASDSVLVLEYQGYGMKIDTSTSGNVPLAIVEQADPGLAAAAGVGRIWVKNSTPNVLMFTDDAGTDFQLN